jgi:hypothetical protein
MQYYWLIDKNRRTSFVMAIPSSMLSKIAGLKKGMAPGLSIQ